MFNLWGDEIARIFSVDLFFKDNSSLTKVVFGAFFVSGFLSLVTLFLYSNRLKQITLGRINISINLLVLGLLLYGLVVLSGGVFVPEKGIVILISFVVILLLTLANKAIKKDEDLVKSVDRLR